MKYSSKVGVFLLSFVFFSYLIAWVLINLLLPHDSEYFNYFTDSYGLIAALGGLFGYVASRKWGGLKSAMGRSLVFFSGGLFFQFLGQVSYAIYFYVLNIENAYPSLGDFFYFSSIPLYIYAIYLLFGVLQLKENLHSRFKLLVSVLIPLGFVSASYYVFLNGYEFDPNALLATLLDFGYPLGAAVFIGLTIVAYLFSSSTLGGALKKNIILLFISLVLQYVADTLYLFHTINETWRAGGLDDLYYLIAYAAMGITLLSFGQAAEKFMSRDGTK